MLHVWCPLIFYKFQNLIYDKIRHKMGSRIRFVHNVPKAPKVDIILGDFELATGLSYKRSSPYLQITPGTYKLQIRAGGKNIYEQQLVLEDGKGYVAIIHGISNAPELLILTDDLTCPDKSRANVRVVHAALNISGINFYYNDRVVYKNLLYGQVGTPTYYSFPAGMSDFTVVKPDTIRGLAGPYSIDLEGGGIYTMIISGSPDKALLIISEDSQKICILTDI